MKKVGITGGAGSGKSTLFRAVASISSSSDVAAVAVPDTRLDKLVDLHQSRKRVPAQIELVDIHAQARSPADATAKLRDMDAILVVAGAFGGLDPAPSIRAMKEDHLIADMGPFETRIERAKKDPAARRELPALEKGMALLESGTFLANREWESDEFKIFSPLAPITLKPHIIVINAGDDGFGGDLAQSEFPAFVANAALEAEVAGLSPEESGPLLQAYGVTEPALGKVISEVYRSLDLITFFTTSDKESRAWEVRHGAKAPEAAGVIHSDMQRGFIRAEVVDYESLVKAGSWDAAKASGLIRVEGKEYVFKEADVTHFRFAI